MPRRAGGTEMKSGPPSFSLSSLSVLHSRTQKRFSSLSFVKFSFDPPAPFFPPPPPPPLGAPLLVFEAQQFFMGILIVPLILLCVFIAPFVKLEAPADKPITIQ